MTSSAGAVTLPGVTAGGPTADALSTVTYYTGVNADGSYAAVNGWVQSLDDTPHKWGAAGAGSSGGTVSYYFDPAARWTATEQNAFRAALALWSDVANIRFVPTANAGGAQYTLSRGASGGGTFTLDGNSGPAGALDHTTSAESEFDTTQYYWSALDSFSTAGGYGMDTVVHEMGHMLGLSHTGDYNGGVQSTDQRNSTDSKQWSVMSYFEPAVDSYGPFGVHQYQDTVSGTRWGASGDGYAQTPTTWMPLDILAVQRLYGVATTTALSGGQVFGFNSNVAGASRPFFDFTQNTTPIITLWDAGTGNTLDLSGFSTGGTVDLRPGRFSSVDGLVNNIGIAYGTAIDGAVGGSGNELFIVNGRTDSIVGGGGVDTVQFTAAGLFYGQFGNPGAESVAVYGSAASTLRGVAVLLFSGAADTVALVGGADAVLQGAGDLVFGGLGSSTVASSGGATLVAGSASMLLNNTVQAQRGGDVAFATSGGGLTVQGGSATDTIIATAASLYGGSGGMQGFGYGAAGLVFVGGGSAATIVAGAGGSETVQGSGLFAGGGAGQNRIVLDGGIASTVFGGGTGDIVTVADGAPNLVVAGPGNELLDGSAATGNDTYLGGSGSDTLLAGAGADLLFPGSGRATLAGGSGADTFAFAYGQSGSSVTVTDWSPADTVWLLNFAGGGQPAAVQDGAASFLQLPDRTAITFLDASAAAVNRSIVG